MAIGNAIGVSFSKSVSGILEFLRSILVQSIVFSRPFFNLDSGFWEWEDRIGVQQRTILESNVYNFDGIDDYVSGLTPMYSDTPDIRIEFDFKRDGIPSVNETFYSEGSSLNGLTFFEFFLSTNGHFRILFRNDSGINLIDSTITTVYTDNVRHRVVWNDDNGNITLTIDDQEVLNTTYVVTGAISFNQASIGNLNTTSMGNFFEGIVSNLKQSRASAPNTLLHWYKMDESDGTDAFDSVADNFDDDVVINGGCPTTTDWINAINGVASGWSAAVGVGSIVTGNGFSGNAQRIDSIVNDGILLYNDNVLSVGSNYRLTFKYRSNVTLRFTNSQSAVNYGTFPSNTGDAVEVTLDFTNVANPSPTVYQWYFRVNNINNWFEVDEVCVEEIISLQTNGTINSDFTSFHITDDDFTSLQNQIGFNNNVGQLIPARYPFNGLDVLGNPLVNKGQVRLNVKAVNSNILIPNGTETLTNPNINGWTISNSVGTSIPVIIGTTITLGAGVLEELTLNDGSEDHVYKIAEGDGLTIYDTNGNNPQHLILSIDIWGTNETTRPDNVLDGFSQKLESITSGTTALPVVVEDGVISRFYMCKNSDANQLDVYLISTNDLSGNGYLIRYSSAERLQLLRLDAGVITTILLQTTTGYLAASGVVYEIELLRNTSDQFTLNIRGGSFGDEFVLVDTTGGGGSNPVVDNTYNNSVLTNAVYDIDATDYIKNHRINGIYQNLISSIDGTGTYYKSRIPARTSTIDAEGDELSNPAGNWHNNAETELLQYPSNQMQDADQNRFWYSAGVPIAKTYDDIVANVSDFVYTDVSVGNQKKNISTVGIDSQPLTAEELAALKKFLNQP